MNDINIVCRDYCEEDFASLNNLWKSTGMGGKERGDDDEVIQQTLNRGGKLIVMMDVDREKLIGSSWISNDGRRLYLHHFGIDPDYQKKGLAKSLLRESLRFVKEKNMQVKLEVHKQNQPAIGLYEKYRFKYLGDYLVYIIRNPEEIDL